MGKRQSGGKTAKGLPKRAGRPAHETRRERSWARGQRRKDERRQANEAAARRNRGLRAAGEPTPWEASRAARRAQRHGAGR